MGGYGSGRRGGSPTSEGAGSYVLSIQDFVRAGVEEGGAAEWSMSWAAGKWQVKFHINACDRSNAWIVLAHESRTEPARDQLYRIALTWTKPPYGGLRWWFLCPRTGRRCTKLFLPRGGHRFWSRQAYGLGYACQRMSRESRLMWRARELHRQLGGDGRALGQASPPKPPGMWRRTYAKKVDRWRAADERAEAAWMESALRLLAHQGGS